MITLKTEKDIGPVYDVKNSDRAFCRYVANWQLWGSFMLIIKIERKRKLDIFLFWGENNSQTFKNY